MDKLDKIFEMQQELDTHIFEQHRDNLPDGTSEWVMKYTIAMESEIDEIRKEVNWKWWKKPKQIVMAKLHEEIIDLWHFLIALSIRVGLTPDKIMEVYEKKRQENFDRQNGTSREKDYRGGN